MELKLSIIWDAGSDQWSTKLRYENKDVAIRFHPESVEHLIKSRNSELPPNIEHSLRNCANLILTSGERIRNHVAEMLFNGWKQHWYDEEIDTFNTLTEFEHALILVGTDIYEDENARTIDFIYSDSGVFGNHWVRAVLDETGRIVDGPFMEG